MLGKRKAQSTLEYITVFAAVVIAILVFAYAKLKPAVGNVLGSAADKITNAVGTFK